MVRLADIRHKEGEWRFKDMKNTHNYDDIIHMPHHVSNKHPQMPIVDRAAQFAPFAALTGHKEAVQETGRVIEQKITLDENKKAMLDFKMQMLLQNMKEHPTINITYFQADDKKIGGAYVREFKEVKKIDDYTHEFVFMDKTRISIDDIYEIQLDEQVDQVEYYTNHI